MPKQVVTPLAAEIIRKRRLEGHSIRKIAVDLNLARATVSWHILEQRKEQPYTAKPAHRPRITTPKTDRTIALAAKRDRFSSNLELATQFHISVYTIRRRLKEFGLFSRLAVKDVLTNKQKRRRVRWCREHQRQISKNGYFLAKVLSN
jgi:DNA invertase Pin-like site-specific DNA recombinase